MRWQDRGGSNDDAHRLSARDGARVHLVECPGCGSGRLPDARAPSRGGQGSQASGREEAGGGIHGADVTAPGVRVSTPLRSGSGSSGPRPPPDP